MYCTNCGKENDPSNIFCMFCGASLEAPPEQAPTPKTSEAGKPDRVGEHQPTSQGTLAGETSAIVDTRAEEPSEKLPAHQEPSAEAAGGKLRPEADFSDPGETPFDRHDRKKTAIPADEERPVATRQPEEAAAQNSSARSLRRRNRPENRTIGVAAIGCTVLVVAGIFVIAALFLAGIVLSREQYLYGIQEEEEDDPLTSIYQIDSNGRNNTELIFERDGLFTWGLGGGYFGNKDLSSYISPDRSHFVFRDEDGDLLLFSQDGGLSIFLSDISLPSSIFEGFSRSGTYFGFTENDDEDVEAIVVDMRGNEILAVPDALFSGFLSDDEFVAVEYDAGGSELVAISIISVRSGNSQNLVNLDSEFNSLFFGVFPSVDGRGVYYFEEDQLTYASVNGGTPVQLFKLDAQSGTAMQLPNSNLVVVLDVPEGESGADLFLVDPAQGTRVRVDKDIPFLFAYLGSRAQYGERSIQFSPNGRYIAYLIETSGELELYVSGVNGSERTRLNSGASWISFAFSPNNRYIAYIDGDDADQGGDLFVSRLDGSDRRRIETDVWSFRFSENSRSLIYFSVEDLDRNNPYSTMYSIDIDGDNKDLLLDAVNGLLAFIFAP